MLPTDTVQAVANATTEPTRSENTATVTTTAVTQPVAPALSVQETPEQKIARLERMIAEQEEREKEFQSIRQAQAAITQRLESLDRKSKGN